VRILCLSLLILAFQLAQSRHAAADVGLGIGKYVCNIDYGSCPASTNTRSVTAVPGSRIQYNINYVNDGSTAGTITITDQIQPGQTYLSASAACTNTGGGTPLVTCSIPNVAAGQSGTVIIQTMVDAGFSGTITNTATGSTGPTVSIPSNQVTVTVTAPAAPPASYFPPSYYYPGYFPGYFPGYYYPPFINPTTPNYSQGPYPGTEYICGLVSQYTPAPPGGIGYLTVNGETLILSPGLVLGGTPLVVGQSFCITFTLANNGQITSLTVGANVAASNYVCGTVQPFSPGYYPYSGYGVYPGYSPYQGYNPYAGYSPYPGYGPFAGYGPTSGYYGWGGPMMIGGYPFYVPPTTYFPYYPQYGNPYCFLMGQQGSITGSLSVVPTAASPVEDPSGWRLPGGRGES
jgi:hypothetical protein